MKDVQINIVNNSSDTHNPSIVLSYEEPAVDPHGEQMPLFWKVFPLKAPEEGVSRKGSTIYPAAMSLGVTRKPDHHDTVPYGTLEIFREVQPGDQLVFSIDQYGALDLALLPDKNDGGMITCVNDSGSVVSVSLYKGDSPLATQFFAPGTRIMFRFSTRLYVACQTVEEVDGVSRTVLTSAPVQPIDLLQSTDITVTLRDVEGGGKDWLVERG